MVDADAVAREVVAPGTPGLEAIAARFGPGVLQADGALDRAALAAVVFADRAARHDLEAITHPAIAATLAQRAAAHQAAGAPAVVVDLPLLVEMGAAPAYDAVVVVAARPQTCVERLVVHRAMRRADALARIRAQAPLRAKLEAATHILWNEGPVVALERRAAALAGSLRARR